MGGWIGRREKRWEGGRGGGRDGGERGKERGKVRVREGAWEGGRGGGREGGERGKERGKVRVREGGREGWKSVYTCIPVGTETQEATFVCTNVFPVLAQCSNTPKWKY